jgi:hypothetical protein
MVSNTMAKKMGFGKSIGGSSGAAPVNDKSVSLGDGKYEAKRVSHDGYPGGGPTMPIAEGKPLTYSKAGKAGKVEPPKGAGKVV